MTAAHWPPLEASHPLVTFVQKLPEILTSAEHNEVWGVKLTPSSAIPSSDPPMVPSDALPPVPTMNVLQKFLRANKNDVGKAAQQLLETLAWRKKFDPLSAAWKETFDDEVFGGLGYVTEIKNKDGKDTVVVWNVYGAVKDKQKTFGDIDTYVTARL